MTMDTATETDARITKLFGPAPMGPSPIDAPFAWTEERIELLKRLFAEGQSAARIAGELGPNVSRNAVIGKLHRLGLRRQLAQSIMERAGIELPPLRKKQGPKPAPARALEASRPAAGEHAIPSRAGEGVRTDPSTTPKPKPFPPVDNSPPTGGIALDDLKASHCRWPVDQADGPIRYCGAPKTDRPQGESLCSYCARHADMAYAPQRKPRSEAQRLADEQRRHLAHIRAFAGWRGSGHSSGVAA